MFSVVAYQFEPEHNRHLQTIQMTNIQTKTLIFMLNLNYNHMYYDVYLSIEYYTTWEQINTMAIFSN